ncbi:hypothetical protein M0Q03_01520 [bacterium]|jgi:hypothetical protein|nr:hypothetical protein [bacterium]
MKELIDAFITSFSGGLPSLIWGVVIFFIGWFIAKRIKVFLIGLELIKC